MSAIRTWAVLFLALVFVSSSQAQNNFAIPNSVVLFGTYDELRAVYPDRTLTIKPPVELPANHGYFARPSISPNGELIAWGFVARVDGKRAHYVLGVYSLKSQAWKTYGDFHDIGQANFSADSTRIIFVAEEERGRELMALDVAAGNISPFASPQHWATTAPFSWSPDGKRVAMVFPRNEAITTVGVLDVSSGKVVDLGEGDYPTWSPDGKRIAFFDGQGAKCIVVRADGTNPRVLKEVRQSYFSYRRFGWGLPVWSPDGQQVLLTEMKGDGDFMDVVLVRVEDGRELRRVRNHLPTFGWAPLSRSDQR